MQKHKETDVFVLFNTGNRILLPENVRSLEPRFVSCYDLYVPFHLFIDNSLLKLKISIAG